MKMKGALIALQAPSAVTFQMLNEFKIFKQTCMTLSFRSKIDLKPRDFASMFDLKINTLMCPSTLMTLIYSRTDLTGYQLHVILTRLFFFFLYSADNLWLRPSGMAILWSLSMWLLHRIRTDGSFSRAFTAAFTLFAK